MLAELVIKFFEQLIVRIDETQGLEIFKNKIIDACWTHSPKSLIIIIIIIKKGRQCKAEREWSDIHPISPKTPAPQYQPIDIKKRKGKSSLGQ